MTHIDSELEAFARMHFAHEVGIPTPSADSPRRRPAREAMKYARNAASQAFYVHARLLDEFLRDVSSRERQSARAVDYSDIPSVRAKPSWLKTVNKQVAHLDWDHGKFPGSESLQDEILLDLKAALAGFYMQLVFERREWFPLLRSLQEVGLSDA